MSFLSLATEVFRKRVRTTRHDTRLYQIAGCRRRTRRGSPEPLNTDCLEDRLLLTGTLSIETGADVSSVAHGESVTYTFAVQFTPGSGGGDPTSADGPSISVTNNTCTPVNAVESGGFNVGDLDTNDRLDSTETWQFNCVFGVPAHSNAESDPINTTAVVTGNDANGNSAEPGISDAIAVEISHPAGTLGVTKSADESSVAHGGSIIYRFDITYTPGADGAPAKNIAVIDGQCDATATLDSGDVNTNNLLDSGETWQFTCTHALAATHSAGEQDPIVNTAAVSGQDFDGDALTVVPSNQVSVDVVHGSISGSKFLDVDGNGVQDAEEPNLRNWTINLYQDADSNSIFDSGIDPQVDTQQTESDGSFSFTNLVPGTYFVREVLQTDFTQTTSNPAAIVITGSESPSGLLFGNQPPTTSIITDPCDETETALLIVGTSSHDSINITRKSGSEITVRSGKTSLGNFSPTGRIIVYGQGGNDKIQISQSISLPMLVRGGTGNDKIFGADGDDILIGGSGNDRITGRRGRDILIGGTGEDRMLGSRAEDILVAGTTDFDGNDEALCAILDEWTSDRDYPTRITNVRGTGIGPRENDSFFLNSLLGTVDDDNAPDRLAGGSDGLDWFLARLIGPAHDRIARGETNEIVDAI